MFNLPFPCFFTLCLRFFAFLHFFYLSLFPPLFAHPSVPFFLVSSLPLLVAIDFPFYAGSFHFPATLLCVLTSLRSISSELMSARPHVGNITPTTSCLWNLHEKLSYSRNSVLKVRGRSIILTAVGTLRILA